MEEKQQEYATLAIAYSQNMQKEIDDELERYRQGEISKEQYEKNKAEITQNTLFKKLKERLISSKNKSRFLVCLMRKSLK